MKKILTIILVIALTTVAIIFGLKYKGAKETLEDTEVQLIETQAQMSAYQNSLTEAWTVAYYTPIEHGRLTEENLVSITIPQSQVNSETLLLKQDILGTYPAIPLYPGDVLTTNNTIVDGRINTFAQDLKLPYYPVGMIAGSYININMAFPFGERLTGLTHIRVEEVYDDHIKVSLDAGEYLLLSQMLADVAAWGMTGVYIYPELYEHPGSFESYPMYPLSPATASIAVTSPDIVDLQRYINDDLRDNYESRIRAIDEYSATLYSAEASARVADLMTNYEDWVGSEDYVAATDEQTATGAGQYTTDYPDYQSIQQDTADEIANIDSMLEEASE